MVRGGCGTGAAGAAGGARPRGGSGRATRRACGSLGVGVAATFLAALLVLAAGRAPALAAGGQQATFAETFARSRLVIVAVVEAAPPADGAFRLAVETSLKGDGGPTLTFPSDATSLALRPGSRVVLLAMDPATLDFRGTVALTVGPDGAIDPDGLTGVPTTVAALIAAYGPAGATAAPTATDGGGRDPGFPWGAVLILAAVGAVALVVAAGDRRRA